LKILAVECLKIQQLFYYYKSHYQRIHHKNK